MCKENTYAKMEKLGSQICRCTRQGFKVMRWYEMTRKFEAMFCKLRFRHLRVLDKKPLIPKQQAVYQCTTTPDSSAVGWYAGVPVSNS